MEEASAFLSHNERAASIISMGVMMCIMSPVLLLLLSGFSETGMIDLYITRANAIGVAILLVQVAIAVAMFIMTMMRGKQYSYLEEINIDTEDGVSGMVKEKSNAYAETHSRRIVIGVMLCIISAVPLFLLPLIKYSNNTDLLPVIGVAGLLITVSIGVKLIVHTCILQGGYDKLLEEGDYTRLSKRASKYDGIYWAIATAIYLAWSFATNRWDFTWLVWVVAGILFAAYKEIMKAILRKPSK